MAVLLSTGEVVQQKEDHSIPLFRLAFRPFFLFGSLFAVIALSLWGLMLSSNLQVTPYGGQLWWHMHEMLFGFVSAIVIGFLLSAVQTWTRVPSIKGPLLMGLVMIWLLARVLLFFPFLPNALTAFIDLLFLPFAAGALLYPIAKVKLWRNAIFMPILLFMTACNFMMHYAVAMNQPSYQQVAATAMVMVVTLLMTIMAGRVFPMFTANGTQTEKVVPISWLEKSTVIGTLLGGLLSLHWFSVIPYINAWIFFTVALLHAYRVFRWKIWVTLKTPLVWSLHLSYWAIPLGFLLLGLSEITRSISQSQALHSFTVGAMSSMILAMISRVSLGHTGRKIAVGKVMAAAFILIFLATLVRVFGSLLITNYSLVLQVSLVLWIGAYAIFISQYARLLTTPRIDGSPG